MRLVHTEVITDHRLRAPGPSPQSTACLHRPHSCSVFVPADADRHRQTMRTDAQWNPSSAAWSQVLLPTSEVRALLRRL